MTGAIKMTAAISEEYCNYRLGLHTKIYPTFIL